MSLLSHAYTPPVFAKNTTTETDETMVVTANRFEQSAKDVIAPVEVVTKEDIEAMQAKSLDEVLRRLPGVQIGKKMVAMARKRVIYSWYGIRSCINSNEWC